MVDAISFTVDEGDVFGFLGPNGPGKTTTIRVVLDILKPDAGNVDWYRKGSGLPMGDETGDAFFILLRAEIADESLSPDQVLRIVAPAEYTLFSIDDEGRPESSGSAEDEVARAAPAFIFAMLLLISIFVGAASLLQGVGEEKQNRMVEMLITTTSPLSIMLGKALALGAAGLL